MADYNKQQPPSYGGPLPQIGYGAPPQGYGPPPVAGYNASHTTVIVNQPRPGAPGAAPRLWSTGLCDICDDMGICICAMFCGICFDCRLAADMGESACIPCCVPAYSITLRTKWRTQENIQGSIMDDCLVAAFCAPCAACQLGREVKAKKNNIL